MGGPISWLNQRPGPWGFPHPVAIPGDFHRGLRQVLQEMTATNVRPDLITSGDRAIWSMGCARRGLQMAGSMAMGGTPIVMDDLEWTIPSFEMDDD